MQYGIHSAQIGQYYIKWAQNVICISDIFKFKVRSVLESFSSFGAPRIILYICCFGLSCLQDLKIKKIIEMAKNMHVEKNDIHFQIFQLMHFFTRADSL